MVDIHRRHLRLLLRSTRSELDKRYAGSLLGRAWLVLFPLLFLCVYLFVWLVVFKVRFPGMSQLGYVAFVFAGLVPFLFFIEVMTTSPAVIKQNVHLIKSVIMPIELISSRAVLAGFVGHVVGIGLMLVVVALEGSLSWRIALLPVVVTLQLMFCLGVSWLLAPIGVVVPDLTQFANISSMLLMFLSPISFKPSMVPVQLQIVLLLNPVAYMAEAYRSVVIDGYGWFPLELGAFAAISLATFVIGASVYQKFKGAVIDYE